jgi:uncharacterized protein YutE (UPF0331/DUF86 family)
MVSADVVAAKLAVLKERIDRARTHCPATSADLARDRDALDIVAFNLMLAVQSCVDVASHVIADEGWAPATTLAAAFVALHRHGVISSATAESLGRAAGLRNVVAHGYAALDVEMVHRAATRGLDDLEAFLAEMAAWTQSWTQPRGS